MYDIYNTMLLEAIVNEVHEEARGNEVHEEVEAFEAVPRVATGELKKERCPSPTAEES